MVLDNSKKVKESEHTVKTADNETKRDKQAKPSLAKLALSAQPVPVQTIEPEADEQRQGSDDNEQSHKRRNRRRNNRKNNKVETNNNFAEQVANIHRAIKADQPLGPAMHTERTQKKSDSTSSAQELRLH